jgi:hypothetical protein
MVVLPMPGNLRISTDWFVKMSLASRNASGSSAGTFSTINPQDKRLVEVPLAEIFKRVSPAILKRRDDQRYSDSLLKASIFWGRRESVFTFSDGRRDVRARTGSGTAAAAASTGNSSTSNPADAARDGGRASAVGTSGASLRLQRSPWREAASRCPASAVRPADAGRTPRHNSG